MKRNLLYLLGVLLLLSGCFEKEDKEEVPEPATEPEIICYLQKIETTYTYADGASGSTREYFTYDTSDRLIKTAKHSSDGMIFSNTFEYDANGRLTRENMLDGDGNIDSYYDNEYDKEGKVISYTLSVYSNQYGKLIPMSRTVCSYESAKQVKSFHHYVTKDGVETQNGTTQFTYTGGLMTRSLRLDKNNQKVKEIILAYDDKKKYMSALPAYWVQMVAEGFPHEHNIMSKAVTDATGNAVNKESFTQTATYTPEGYLASYSRKYADVKTEQATYTYTCK
ncbi:hypothetical protein [Pontibacter ruber]|uniref:YD repeat-containing protein n=1 Tax=Pontibacter ruber TaxID=1343895 RepID=A0ABW5D066_9BACT|nr:hypothetical protein [Pontibacter ruber]